MAKAFLDTNVILYANDARDPVKQHRAIEAVAGQFREGCLRRERLPSAQKSGASVREPHPFPPLQWRRRRGPATRPGEGRAIARIG
jgi:hypothetical protein